jgi:hypothetical protein
MGMVQPMKEDVDWEAHQMQYTSPCCLHQKSHRPSSMSPHESVGAHWAPWYWPGMHWIAHMTTDSCAQNSQVSLSFFIPKKHGSQCFKLLSGACLTEQSTIISSSAQAILLNTLGSSARNRLWKEVPTVFLFCIDCRSTKGFQSLQTHILTGSD